MTRSLLALAAVALVAQAPPPGQPDPSAADLYHQGAQAFVDGDNAAALQAVDAGLGRAPDDARLQALRDLIEQQGQQDDSQDGGQRDPAENADPGDGGQEGSEGDEGTGEPGPPEDGEAAADQTRAAPPPQGDEAQDAAPRGEMSRAQAERILDAVGGEERLLLRELRRAPTQRPRSDKDW